MPNADPPLSPEDQALQKAENALDAQIGLCARLTETAFKHIQQMPNATSLAGVTRALDLLQSFLPEAERLKDKNRPDIHLRLTNLLDDVKAARNTWASTLGILADFDLKDTKKLIGYQAASVAQQKKLNDELFKQEQNHATEVKKLL
jgi:hypothetical protein